MDCCRACAEDSGNLLDLADIEDTDIADDDDEALDFDEWRDW